MVFFSGTENSSAIANQISNRIEGEQVMPGGNSGVGLAVAEAMIAGRETQKNGILKMLALPVSRHQLSLAKFCVLVFYLFMEMIVFLVVFVLAGMIATSISNKLQTVFQFRAVAESNVFDIRTDNFDLLIIL